MCIFIRLIKMTKTDLSLTSKVYGKCQAIILLTDYLPVCKPIALDSLSRYSPILLIAGEELAF